MQLELGIGSLRARYSRGGRRVVQPIPHTGWHRLGRAHTLDYRFAPRRLTRAYVLSGVGASLYGYMRLAEPTK